MRRREFIAFIGAAHTATFRKKVAAISEGVPDRNDACLIRYPS